MGNTFLVFTARNHHHHHHVSIIPPSHFLITAVKNEGPFDPTNHQKSEQRNHFKQTSTSIWAALEHEAKLNFFNILG